MTGATVAANGGPPPVRVALTVVRASPRRGAPKAAILA